MTADQGAAGSRGGAMLLLGEEFRVCERQRPRGVLAQIGGGAGHQRRCHGVIPRGDRTAKPPEQHRDDRPRQGQSQRTQLIDDTGPAHE